jgi:hypothetical protein
MFPDAILVADPLRWVRFFPFSPRWIVGNRQAGDRPPHGRNDEGRRDFQIARRSDPANRRLPLRVDLIKN